MRVPGTRIVHSDAGHHAIGEDGGGGGAGAGSSLTVQDGDKGRRAIVLAPAEHLDGLDGALGGPGSELGAGGGCGIARKGHHRVGIARAQVGDRDTGEHTGVGIQVGHRGGAPAD